MIQRDRPIRRPFVPRQAIIAIAAAGIVLVAVVALAVALGGRSQVEVPDLIGLDEDVARVALAQAGLEVTVSERPFDRSDEGTVLGQTPEPGSMLAEGEAVVLIVSAGTEEVELPDVTGLASRIARAQLEQLGLVVRLTPMESDAPSDTVLAQNPSPGAVVHTASIVNLTVAAESAASEALLPYSFTGTTVVIDPAFFDDAPGDVSMEVARRLGALLQTSGATIQITRSAASTDTSPAGRAAVASAANPTVQVGIDAPTTGEPGFSVTTLAENVAPSTFQASRLLADEVATKLREDGSSVRRSTLGADPVLQAADAPGIRVRLGAYSDPEDAVMFSDPAWADTIARAIYRALGERMGSQ